MTDRKEDTAPTPTAQEGAKIEYLEYVGEKPYGTEFIHQHTVTRKQLKDYRDVTTDKDLSWTKGKNGRMLVPISDMSPEAAEALEADPVFRRVTL